jgi:hypothetical protein
VKSPVAEAVLVVPNGIGRWVKVYDVFVYTISEFSRNSKKVTLIDG